MRIVIVGPGALGSVFAALLARGGHDVSLLGRPTDHLRALQRDGLRLQTPSGVVEQIDLHATDDPAVVAGADAAIVLVKTPDTAAAMRAIRPHLGAAHVILTLQNGLGNAERIRDAIGAGPRILTGVTSQAAHRLGPGAVVHAGEGPTLIGAVDAADSDAAARVAAAFNAAAIPTVTVADIETAIWRKVAVNAAINGLTALGGFPNGTIARVGALLDAAEIIAEEAASVARARGIELGGMRRSVQETALATSGNRSSMLQDLEAGRPTEVEAIHGAIVASGAEAGIATPATQVLAALIRSRSANTNSVERIDD
jgi:2-dehydropantoate 2-reductase